MGKILEELATRFMVFVFGVFLAFIGFRILELFVSSSANKDYFVWIMLFLPLYILNFICTILVCLLSILLIAISLDPRERFH
jgi:hypothetical protein